MEAERDKETHSQTLSEDEKRRLRLYDRLPHGGGLLRQQSRERWYFDSGDLALSTADRMTDEGAIQTGTAHPIRDTISRPYAPVPNTSNANKDANKGFSGTKPQIPEMIGSPLHEPTNNANMEIQKPD
ncbi:hypothetical protein F9C07_1719355 [Aspergillus flavus]|uniref:mRNA stability protein n=2 Tax=Aspergillus flavus TaxID=5059 RepID=A0A7U2MJQ7_ASPFN|nr:uncharacterized protein G4B84_008793 [Aspergillus flavus NRRL3357]KAB8251062.1 hypothetical protein BDV35DRAFT_388451 [Aspergillus flavus]KOC12882.1 hypothetical protein AFLA70_9g006370 [Aspergillus flavus AF70]KAF7616276.1 hypothetical protein AFLA_009773 [Aspergillus flavus NRRL3357]QMW33362.1 hypothetical protein G4B84_008793 [Aspergillus flavus NRRL3357]QMW45400.1 hypothetical protein G4B11_008820 [Aspergillus flavus]